MMRSRQTPFKKRVNNLKRIEVLHLFDFFIYLQRLLNVFGEYDTADVFCIALSPRLPTPSLGMRNQKW